MASRFLFLITRYDIIVDNRRRKDYHVSVWTEMGFGFSISCGYSLNDLGHARNEYIQTNFAPRRDREAARNAFRLHAMGDAPANQTIALVDISDRAMNSEAVAVPAGLRKALSALVLPLIPAGIDSRTRRDILHTPLRELFAAERNACLDAREEARLATLRTRAERVDAFLASL